LTISEPSEAAFNPNYEKLVAPNSYLPDAHNLYIETTLGTGIIGAIFLIGDLFLAIGWFGRKASRTGLASYGFAFSVLLWMSLESTLEAVSPQPFFPLLIFPILLVKAACVSDRPSAERSTATFNESETLTLPEVQHA
jgi:O-antigen ligase